MALVIYVPSRAQELVGAKIMRKESVGAFLVDGFGMSLYTYAKDAENSSNCLEGCAATWQPFHIAPPEVAKGLRQKDFGTISRSDNLEQTTYRGKPLYYFMKDRFPGDTFGEGVGDVWFLATPPKKEGD
jgi:predicted lipoprotein with Yx(FWY)xxD motif